MIESNLHERAEQYVQLCVNHPSHGPVIVLYRMNCINAAKPLARAATCKPGRLFQACCSLQAPMGMA